MNQSNGVGLMRIEAWQVTSQAFHPDPVLVDHLSGNRLGP